MTDPHLQTDAPTVGLLGDYLMGTPTQVARHLVARQAFLRVFLADQMVDRLFERWLEETDSMSLRSSLENMVLIEKADHWSDGDIYPLRNGVDLWSNERLLESLASPDVGFDGVGGGPFERALISVSERTPRSALGQESEWPNFVAEAEQFVIYLKAPYPWLVLALLREFLGRHMVFEKIDEPGPMTTTRFGRGRWIWPVREGPGAEGPRSIEFEADSKIRQVSAPLRQSLERNAAWFFRAVVRDESIRKIARSEFGDDGDKRRRDISSGVRRIRDLFELRPRSEHELETNGHVFLLLDLIYSR